MKCIIYIIYPSSHEILFLLFCAYSASFIRITFLLKQTIIASINSMRKYPKKPSDISLLQKIYPSNAHDSLELFIHTPIIPILFHTPIHLWIVSPKPSGEKEKYEPKVSLLPPST